MGIFEQRNRNLILHIYTQIFFGKGTKETWIKITSPVISREIRDQMLSKSGSTISRMSWRGDRWGCNNCSKTYDKWGMIDHQCIKNGRNFTEPPRGATGRSTTATAFTVVDDNKFCKAEREVNTKDMTQITELSEEAKQIIQRNIEARQQDSKFVKLQPGEKRVLSFVPEKTEQVQAEFNGKKSLRFRYIVIEDGSRRRPGKIFRSLKKIL